MKVVLLEVSFRSFFLWISQEIKGKVRVVLLEVLFMNFSLLDIQADQKIGESRVTQSMIDELHSWDIQGDQKDV